MKPFSLNIKGKIVEVKRPLIMGVVNLTSDSFYMNSRVSNDSLIDTISRMVEEGVDIVDVGACSTRPHSVACTEEEEWQRLKSGLSLIKETFKDLIISVDTFRASIAEKSITEYGVDIINDVSGGVTDKDMKTVISRLKAPYILTHPGIHFDYLRNDKAGNLSINHEKANINEGICTEVIRFLSNRIRELAEAGVCDVIADPGIGFGKTPEEGLEIIKNIDVLGTVLGRPILIGVSRKSIITESLGCNAENALNGTTILNTVAVLKGASILRVHDVYEAKQVVDLLCYLS